MLALYAPDGGQVPGAESRPVSHSDGEIRCYHLSAATLRREQELLDRYGAKDFRDLLTEIHRLLVGLVRIMKSTPHEVRVRGYVIASLGCLLEQVSSLAFRMRNVYATMEKRGH